MQLSNLNSNLDLLSGQDFLKKHFNAGSCLLPRLTTSAKSR